MQPRVTVLHMINGLNVGGAEAVLVKLVSHPAITGRDQRHEVQSLMRPGLVGEGLRDAGLPVRSLNMTRGMPNLGAAVGLARVMRWRRACRSWPFLASSASRQCCVVAKTGYWSRR